MKNKKNIIRCIAIVVAVLIVLPIIIMLTGCGNRVTLDNTERAIITLPNGEVIDGEVVIGTDVIDGDMIQVSIADKTYLVYVSHVVVVDN